MSDRVRICPGCNATFGWREGHACATTVYAGEGAGHLAMTLLAEKARELDAARAHIARLEESLRVALAARAEAVEVLGEVEQRGIENGCALCGDHFENVRGEIIPHAPGCRLARVLGRGK